MNSKLPERAKYFKEEMIINTSKLNPSKSIIQNVVDIIASAHVIDSKLIKIEEGHSNEGQILTGYKLIVDLNIKEKILYTIENEFNKQYNFYLDIPKVISIVLPKEVDGKSICSLYRANKLLITPYIETIKYRLLDYNKLNQCILIFINVEIIY